MRLLNRFRLSSMHPWGESQRPRRLPGPGHGSQLTPQVMCYAMALTTLGKLLQHRLGMGVRVADRARWCELVFVLMASHTAHVVVFGRGLGQQVVGVTVTGRAPLVGRLLTVCDDQGHVHRMARHTGLKIHVLGVFFVTIHAAGNLPMGCVAIVASHICMGAGVFFDLNTLLLVAGQAGRCNLPLQLHIKRGMDVRVTA